MRYKTMAMLLMALALFGCVDDSQQDITGVANVTDMADLPKALNSESSGWFGVGILITFFLVPMVVLSAYNRKENAMLASLFSCFVISGILVALEAVTPLAPVVILAIMGGLILYGFIKG